MKHTSFFSLLPLIALVSPVHGQENQEPESQESDYELVTTAIRRSATETALPVTVIRADELRGLSRSTLGDTLGNQPGISNASYGPAVGQAVIRGQSGRRIMTLSNSIPNADASANSPDHSVALEPVLADAIEVLRGPATLLHGGGAIGGVVNVIDNRVSQSLPEQPLMAFEARHDTAADQDTVVGRLEFAAGRNWVWRLDALRREWNDLDIPSFAIGEAWLEDDHDEEHHEDEDHAAEEEHHEEEIENTYGHIANTGGETKAGTLGGSFIFADGRGFAGFSVNRLENDYGLPPGAHGHGEEEHGHEEEEHEGEDRDEDEHHEEEGHEGLVSIAMESTRYDFKAQWNDLNHILESFTYNLAYTNYEHRELEGEGIVGTRFSNDSWQQRLQLAHVAMNGWHGVLGLQTTSEEFGAVGAESFIPVTEISSQGLFLVEDFHAGDVTFELGARLNRDHYEPKDSAVPELTFSTRSFSASALWDLNAALSAGLTFSHAERAPSIEELYSNYGRNPSENCVIHAAASACEVGNSTFEKESSGNVDLVLYLDHGNLNATITAFHNDFDDYIFQGNTGQEFDGFAVRTYQQGKARFSGLEIDAIWNLTEAVDLRVFGDRINGKLQDHGDVPRMPPSRIGVELDYETEQWSAFVSVLRASAQDRPGLNELPTEGYVRWDMGLDYTVPTGNDGEVLLFLKGRNLGDEEIRLSTSFLRGFAPEAGRSIELGLRYRFGG